MTQFKCDHLDQEAKKPISISFTPFSHTNQDNARFDEYNPYFLFTLISTKQVFLTPASPTPYLVKLQRPATNCCHDLYTFVTFDTVYLVCLGQPLKSNFLTLSCRV